MQILDPLAGLFIGCFLSEKEGFFFYVDFYSAAAGFLSFNQ
jgi:hypothetical protein